MPINNEPTPTFESYLIHTRHKPLQEIMDIFDSKKTPFSKNIFFSYNPAYLGANEWNRCVDFYIEKTPHGTMVDTYNILSVISQDENPHIQDLEQLAIEIVSEMYGVPKDVVTLKASIREILGEDLNQKKDNGSIDDDDDDDECLSEEDKARLEPLVQKRIILNSIMHGAAVHQWTSAFHLGIDKLNEINPDLIEHYNSYASLVNYFNWQHPMALMNENTFNIFFNIGDNNQGIQRMLFQLMQQNNNQQNQEQNRIPETPCLTQGYNEVDYQSATINAYAINFPVLIHELSKGILEYLFGISMIELTKKEFEYVDEISSKYSHEFWHYYMGPTLWRKLLECADVPANELPAILSYIAEMEYEDLSKLFLQIVYDTEGEGKKSLYKIKKQTNNESN